MAACSSLPSLGGKGVQVAANTQAGKTNIQSLGQTEINEVVIRPKARVDSVKQTRSDVSTESVEKLTVNQVPVWLILLFGLVCGFLIPSPKEIYRGVRDAFK